MRETVCFLLVMSCLCVSAQKKGQARIDSLVTALPSASFDTTKAKMLLEIAAFYSNTNANEGVRYAEQAIDLCEKLNASANLAVAYNVMGNCLKNKSDYTNAIVFHKKALAVAQRTRDERAVASAYVGMGSCYLYQGLYSKAVASYLDALGIYEKIGDRRAAAAPLGNLGAVYVYLKDYDKAIEYNQRALKVQEEFNNKVAVAALTSNIGHNYLYKNDFEKAMEYIGRGTKLAEEANALLTVAGNHQAMGRIYQAQRKYPEAVREYQQGFAISEKVGARINMAQNLVTSAEAYLQVVKDSIPSPFPGELSSYNGLLNKALETINRAVAMRTELKDLNGLNFAYETKSEIESLLGNAGAALNSFKEHITYRDSVFNLEKTTEIKRRELQYEFGKREDSIKFEQALTSQRLEKQQLLGKQQQQALLLVNKEKDLQRLTYLQEQARLEREKETQAALFEKNELAARLAKQSSDKQIAAQKLQISSDRKIKIYLGIAAASVLLIAFLIYFNQQRTKRLNRIISKQKEELEELGHVKDRIFSVVIHDMRAPVNSLISFIDILEDDMISQDKLQLYAGELKNQLSHTSVLMDNLLNWASSQMSGFTPLIESLSVKEIVDHTIALLEQQATHKNIRIVNRVNADMKVKADRNMLALIVRNLLGNAVKFTPEHGSVTINAGNEGSLIGVNIADTGTGMPIAKLNSFNDPRYMHAIDTKKGTHGETGTGLGLMLCKTFAALMKGSMRAESTEGAGSAFTLSLPEA